MNPVPPPSRAPVPLPAVAVVDRDLVARRRRIARPVQKVAFPVTGAALGVQLVLRDSGVTGAVLTALVVAGGVVSLWSLPWAAVRPATSWYLGIEPDGLRLPWLLAPTGQVFLPWWALGRVSVRRYALVFAVLRLRVRPEVAPLLAGVDPLAVAKVVRRGFSLGLQGTSMSARQAAQIIATVRR